MAPISVNDLESRYEPPFPPDVPTIELREVTIEELLDTHNAAVSQKLFSILSAEGFFYLDLRRGTIGPDFCAKANELHDAAKHVFNEVSVEEKETYMGNPFAGELDQGYRALAKDDDGLPRVSEFVQVPTNSLLNDPSFTLPQWLAPYQPAYRAFADHASTIGQALLHHLEAPLGLMPDSLASLHKISNTTGGFIRMFRSPAPKKGALPLTDPLNPPHTDGNSITILFNWQGGLQIARPKSGSAPSILSTSNEGEEWLWVRPRAGFALINLGDPLVVLTNGVLRSGLHRVILPPGEQAAHHRYSVLAGLRARKDTKMRALRSSVIPEENETQRASGDLTVHEWARQKVVDIIKRTSQAT